MTTAGVLGAAQAAYDRSASDESYETLDTIQKVETSTEPATQDRPVNPVYILSVAIEER